MFQEYINNVISSGESTRGGLVMITLRAKMRLYVSATNTQHLRGATAARGFSSFRFDGLLFLSLALSFSLVSLPVLLRFTEIYYPAISTLVLSAT